MACHECDLRRIHKLFEEKKKQVPETKTEEIEVTPVEEVKEEIKEEKASDGNSAPKKRKKN